MLRTHIDRGVEIDIADPFCAVREGKVSCFDVACDVVVQSIIESRIPVCDDNTGRALRNFCETSDFVKRKAGLKLHRAVAVRITKRSRGFDVRGSGGDLQAADIDSVARNSGVCVKVDRCGNIPGAKVEWKVSQ